MKSVLWNLVLVGICSLVLFGCSQDTQTQSVQTQSSVDDVPSWNKVNENIIEEFNVSVRTRSDIPKTNLVSNIGSGEVHNIMELPSIELSEGVFAKAYWGQGNLVSLVTLEPNATLQKETISGERFMFVWKGEVEEIIDGTRETLIAEKRESPNGVNGGTTRKDFVYLQEGSESSIQAGENGARLMMVYAPVPHIYLEKYGSLIDAPEININDFPIPPNVEPNRIYDLYDFQFTELVPGSNARLINGQGLQMSFLRMDPNTEFAYHNHPEEQIMIGLRGYIDEYILADTIRMKAGAVLDLPAFMVHGGKLGPYGSDALDVFYPPRTDYIESMNAMLDRYHAIIPEDAEAELLIDGSVTSPTLNFTEGPAWLNGKLYFSNMYFDADFNGDPERSSLIEMDANGNYRNINSGQMQTNGIIPSSDGNLIVADMFGHRIVKMDTDGEVIEVLVDKYDGNSIDGPNDLVIDDKGGFYFTDPQFTPATEKNQPGRTVYYRNVEGDVIRLLPYDDFAMPNGIVLSPDGNTFYINNTYDNEVWWNVDSNKDHFVWAYDVNDDGSISNGRKFAELKLTGDVLNRMGRTSGADGMTIDQNGNLYVATYAGLQIFSSEGVYIGMVNLPTYPVNVTFGGNDYQTLYITSYDRIYSIQTNVKGYQLHSN